MVKEANKKKPSEVRLKLTHSFDYYRDLMTGSAGDRNLAAALLTLTEQLVITEDDSVEISTGELGPQIARGLHNIGCAIEKVSMAMEGPDDHTQ